MAKFLILGQKLAHGLLLYQPGEFETKLWLKGIGKGAGISEILDEADWEEYEESETQNTPDHVDTVPHLLDDLTALTALSKLETPPPRLLRGVSVNQAVYGFVDTLGGGFGSTFWSLGLEATKY
eukprot:4216216-Ditylum_brightwellii.AAC.1